MSKKKKSILGVAFIVVIALAIFMPGMIQAGSLEPSGPPGPTTQIPPAWSQTIAGAERFELVLGGEGVLDKETGLVWEKELTNVQSTWGGALFYCAGLSKGGRKGWHLPTASQLSSLVDTTQINPALPNGHPFANVQMDVYWSASTNATETGAYSVRFDTGLVNGQSRVVSYYIWCVRGGQSQDAY